MSITGLFNRSAGRVRGLIVLAAGVSMWAGGCPPAASTSANDNASGAGDAANVGATVRMKNIAFDPPTVTIQVGQAVRWVNEEPLPIVHTVTSGDPDEGNAGQVWDSGNVAPGQSFTRTFDEPGAFEYFCEIHPGIMRDAMVIVEP